MASLGSSPLDLVASFFTSSIGMARSSELTAILPQVATNLWAAFATGRIMPVLSPILLNFLILPALGVVKAIAKTMIFIGVIAWLLSSMVPVFLASVGMTGAGVFVGRAFQHSPLYTYTESIDLNSYTNITARGLEYMELDSDSCRRMLSCRAGEFVVENFPIAAQIIRATSIGGFFETYARASEDQYVQEAVDSLLGKRNGTCEAELDPCLSLTRIESMFDEKKEEILRNLTMEAATTTSTTTTTTSSPNSIPDVLTNDFVINAIKKAASTAGKNSNFFFNLFNSPKIGGM
jgi:hypothetical protein